MSRVLVVGSGASGVHFALTALERGHEVTMVDVGHSPPTPLHPEATFDELKSVLPDPVGYFLGERGEGVVYPEPEGSFYGHPPSKGYVFDVPAGFAARSQVMKPLFSFARGGFAEAWTAGSYAFSREDLEAFPFRYEELERCYVRVARRIGIGGIADDLAQFIPLHEGYLPPLPLDAHSQWLWDRYHARREGLQRRLGFYLGRSRVATLGEARGDRGACAQLGRCLWGCPTGAIYTPAATLRECLAQPGFRYLSGVLARHFEFDGQGRITRLVARRLGDGAEVGFEVEQLALAAGALPSSKLVLDSLYRRTGTLAVLRGLMDNRQIHLPFLSPRLIGHAAQTASYQFHHLATGIAGPTPADYVHGQITTLKAAAVHPIVQGLPMELGAALRLFRALRAGLGVANLNLADARRDDSYVTLQPVPGSEDTVLEIRYRDDPGEPARVAAAIRTMTRALRRLGCFVPPGLTRIRPKGASVHYAGTLPMSSTRREFSCDAAGRSHDFPNLLLVDGASFPFLPAKNLTFTLMANATRIAAAL